VSFLADHLGRWAEAFALGVKAATPLPYYAALADLMSGWVSADAGALGVAPDRLSGRLARDPVHEAEAFTCPMATPPPPSQEEPEDKTTFRA
jgi:hypothetical protein